jgi:membrane protein
LRSKSSAPVSACLLGTTNMQDAEAERLSIIEVCQRSIQNFLQHSMLTYASALAYQGLFALFPFLIFVSLLLIVLQVDGFFDRLIDQA